MQMKKPILQLIDLSELNFISLGKEPLENGDFYRRWSFKKNDSEIQITYEFNSKFEFINGYVDFNCEKLQGRELSKKDIQLLIEIM